MTANARQVGGTHYKGEGLQHWDLAILFQWDPFQYQVTKYVMRWRDKNGLQDLEKCRHFIDKYIEAVKAGQFTKEARVGPLDFSAWHYMLMQSQPQQSPEAFLAAAQRHNARITTQFTGNPDDQIDVALHVRDELSALVSCSSPNGSVELAVVKDAIEFRDAVRGISIEDLKGAMDLWGAVRAGALQPHAWTAFTFEGSKVDADMYRCKTCKAHFEVPINVPPVSHECSQVEPTNP